MARMFLHVLPTRLLAVSVMLVALLACQIAGPAADAATAVGGELPVGGILGPVQFEQKGASIAAGGQGYLLVWQDMRSQTDYDIYGVMLDANGQPRGEESFLISSAVPEPGVAPQSAPGDQVNPAVAFNGASYLVVWQDYRLGLHNPHICGARVSASGTVLDADGLAVSSTISSQDSPAVASDGTSWQVVWAENTTFGPDIYGARVTATGTVTGLQALASSANNEEAPAISWSGSRYLVAWEDYGNAEVTGADVYGCLVDSNGQKILYSDALLSFNPVDPTSGALGSQTSPAVAGNGLGTMIVVWADSGGVDANITGASVEALLSTIYADPITVNAQVGDQEYPSVCWNGSNFVSCWRNKGDHRRVYAARINQSGTVLDTSGLAVSADMAGLPGPVVAGTAGKSIVGWSSFGLYAPMDIICNSISSGGSIGTETIASVAPQDQQNASVAFDGSNYVAVWADNRSGVYAIYAARISQSGTVLDPQGVQLAILSQQQKQPSIACSGTSFLVTWAENATGGRNIKGLRISRDLVPLDPSPLDICSIDMNQYSPVVCYGGGTYLVVWVDERNALVGDETTDLWGAMVDPQDGEVLSLTGAVCWAPGNELSPAITYNGTNFMVAWQDDRSGIPAIYCARVTPAGDVLDEDGVMVCTSVEAEQSQPAVTTDGTNFCLAWTDYRGDSADIRASVLSPTFTRLVPDKPICADPSEQSCPSLAWTGASYAVVWQDYRAGSAGQYDIYMNSLYQSGALGAPLDTPVSGASDPETRPVAAAASGGKMMVLYNKLHYSINRLVGRICTESAGPPVVYDEGQFTSQAGRLYASWTAPGDTLECSYAIGTTPHGTDIVGWASVGNAREVTAQNLGLVKGTTYYFAVKARDSKGVWGTEGVSDGIKYIPLTANVSACKALADTEMVSLSGKLVTAGNDEISGCFYIEEQDRSSGIRVSWSGSAVREGDVVDLVGTVRTVYGERQVQAEWMRVRSSGAVLPEPLGMSIRSLGGLALNASTPGVVNARGLHNLGLLTRCWGRVYSQGLNSFVLDDESRYYVDKFNWAPIRAEVICPAGFWIPSLGSFVSVTGISSCDPDGNRRLLIRKDDDLVIF